MVDDNLSLRAAGDLISNSGLADDVRTVRNEKALGDRGVRSEAQEYDDSADSDEIEHDDDGTYDDDAEPASDADSDDSAYDGDADHDERSEEDAQQGQPSADDTEYEVLIDGKPEKVKLSDLKEGYQNKQKFTESVQRAAQQHEALRKGHERAGAQFTQQAQELGQLFTGVRELLVGDLDSAEMQNLRATDPQQWLLAREEMQSRIQTVDSVLNNLKAKYERHVQQHQQQQNQILAARIEQETILLEKHVPDWRSEGKSRVARFLADAGFSQSELNGVVDHRMLLIAEQARQFAELKANAASAKDRQKAQGKAPKRANGQDTGPKRKSGKGPTERSRRFKEAKERARKSGSMRDAGNAIAKLLD